jgi:hypothetical protein
MDFNVSHGPHLQVETFELKYCNYCFCPETWILVQECQSLVVSRQQKINV